MTLIKGIAEIVLNVHDVEKSLAFYRDILGLNVIGRPGPVFLQAGDPAVSVPQMVVLVPLPPGSPAFVTPRTLHHLALELAPEDFEAQQAKLRDLGFEIRTGQHPVIPSRTMYVDDPDGNEVEFICGVG